MISRRIGELPGGDENTVEIMIDTTKPEDEA